MGRVPNGFPAGMDGCWPAGKWPTPTSRGYNSEGDVLGLSKMVPIDEAAAMMGTWGKRAYDRAHLWDKNWPAGPGEQHEWEPPRVATGIKDRVNRLKCLGNAVVPAQVSPILKAIAEVENNNL